MIDRWTKKQMEALDDVDFAVEILHERKNKLHSLAPLACRIREAIQGLRSIKNEKNKITTIIGDFIREFEEHTEYCKEFDKAETDMQFYDAGRYECLMEIKKQIDDYEKNKKEG